MLLLRREDIEAALPMPEAIGLMGQAFGAISGSSAKVAERQVLDCGSGHALLMGAFAPGRGIVGKLVTVMPGNQAAGLPVSSGLAVLVDGRDGSPLGLLDATALTAWRTAAAAGFATRLLSSPDAALGVLVGCGTQARAQLLAMDSVRNLKEIHLLARDFRRAERLARTLRPLLKADLVVAGSQADWSGVLRRADIITAATTSATPVIDGHDVPAGCHVNGIGSFRPEMREFDETLVARADIYVESRETAEVEAGELIAARDRGVTRVEEWREIGELTPGESARGGSTDRISFYKSVGHALFDLFAASEVCRRAAASGLGTEWLQ